MMLLRILALVFGVIIVRGASTPRYAVVDSAARAPEMCGFKPSVHDLALVRKLAAKEVEQDKFAGPLREDSAVRSEAQSPSSSVAIVEVQTYFHVVAETEQTRYFLTNATLQKQLEVLNEDYALAGFSFKLVSTSRTVNKRWARRAAIDDIRAALHKGTWRDLNVYFIPRFPLFGICSLPASSEDVAPDLLREDGCIVRWDTLPGGSLENFNMGKTAVHEVGHWLGLFHTFEGGCKGEGDLISDTPPQRNATGGCPKERDSCPDMPGLDPIHNYMDYSFDVCYTEFTPGQIRRMHDIWKTYRAGPPPGNDSREALT